MNTIKSTYPPPSADRFVEITPKNEQIVNKSWFLESKVQKSEDLWTPLRKGDVSLSVDNLYPRKVQCSQSFRLVWGEKCENRGDISIRLEKGMYTFRLLTPEKRTHFGNNSCNYNFMYTNS